MRPSSLNTPRRSERTAWIAASLALFAMTVGTAHAQGIATFTYQRGAIRIERAQPPPLPALPWQGANAPVQAAPAALEIAVDIRPSSALFRQEGQMVLSGFAERSGILFIFEPPQAAQPVALDYYAPVDVLWIDSQGVIASIAPNSVLAGNRQSLGGAEINRALLLLAGGSAAREGIRPGDRVEGSEYFDKPPELLTIQKQASPLPQMHK